MEDYSINATKATPAINFNLQTGILSINGRSIPEDSVSFFEPLQNIVRQYLEN